MKKAFLSLLLVIGMVFTPALFAAGSTANAEAPGNFLALWEAGERRDKIVTISDIHLGMRVSGFDNAYSFLDFYPAQQTDGTISAPVLFRNIQRTWDERQGINRVKVPGSFIEVVAGTLDWRYFSGQAKTQYLDNPDESVDVVVFGHTHVPVYDDLGSGKYYINDGTWIDHNTNVPEATRTFAVITTGDQVKAGLYRLMEDGSVSDISELYSGAQSK